MISDQWTQLLASNIPHWPPAGKFHVDLSWLQHKRKTDKFIVAKQNNLLPAVEHSHRFLKSRFLSTFLLWLSVIFFE
jgi:heme A synthase